MFISNDTFEGFIDRRDEVRRLLSLGMDELVKMAKGHLLVINL